VRVCLEVQLQATVTLVFFCSRNTRSVLRLRLVIASRTTWLSGILNIINALMVAICRGTGVLHRFTKQWDKGDGDESDGNEDDGDEGDRNEGDRDKGDGDEGDGNKGDGDEGDEDEWIKDKSDHLEDNLNEFQVS
jgi:hypothetical protein